MNYLSASPMFSTLVLGATAGLTIWLIYRKSHSKSKSRGKIQTEIPPPITLDTGEVISMPSDNEPINARICFAKTKKMGSRHVKWVEGVDYGQTLDWCGHDVHWLFLSKQNILAPIIPPKIGKIHQANYSG